MGRSARRGTWRLYLSLALNDYLEFSEQDVVHTQPLSARESQLGGAVVWLRRDSNPVRVRSASREAQADFLQGDIASRLRRVASAQPTFPVPGGVGAFVAGGCLTGGDFDTLCAACTAVPTAFVVPEIRPFQNRGA